jgi:hypothetical protein
MAAHSGPEHRLDLGGDLRCVLVKNEVACIEPDKRSLRDIGQIGEGAWRNEEGRRSRLDGRMFTRAL